MSKTIDLGSLLVDGIDTSDYPDFSDAFIYYGQYDDGSELSDDDLNKLNEDGSLIHELVFATLF